ncbi:phospho-sugar mutase [Pseudothermotoga sp. U03pept]|uniref:phospho-sugar mutase n=1 Tax=Pseudothermotoga sp. U03pept TaxID=3447012 RepID=UPI003F053D01
MSDVVLFGTGGIRGIMRRGEFDEDLILRASKAVASWMISEGLESVAIAYDTRKNSAQYALLAAEAISTYGIKSYLFDRPVPTPVLSFAIRQMKLKAGIVITASHNPPEYNGFKVYTQDGVQAIPLYTDKISSFIDKPLTPSTTSKIEMVPNTLIDLYINSVVELVKPFIANSKGFTIAYSPLHGTGAQFVPTVLRMLGFDVICVEEQMLPDPNFTSVAVPNPEEESSFERTKHYMDKYQIPFAIVTDPDCDRVGFMARGVRLTGNQVGVLLTDLLGKTSPPNSFLFKTIVTTDMVNEICKERNQMIEETPTGFKFIGAEIEKRSLQPNFHYFLAFEESCGYLTGDLVRDKDGVLGSAFISTMCMHFDPVERLNHLYEKYGYHFEKLVSIEVKTAEQARYLYENLSKFPLSRIGEFPVKKVYDYCNDEKIPNETLLMEVEGAKIYIRPSGTEPKLKVYIKVVDENQQRAKRKIEKLEGGLREIENLT